MSVNTWTGMRDMIRLAVRLLEPVGTRYWWTRFVILRLLGFVYFMAFLSLYIQLKGLIGSDGLLPAARWLAYEFHAKPGDPRCRPPVISPYHHRVDWQIWFAAMSRIEHQPWLLHLVYKLLHGNPHTLSLIRENPFPSGPPRYIRADLYRYEFTTRAGRTSAWWKRDRVAAYLVPVSKDHLQLVAAMKGYGFIDP